jgi:hypothetical protein
MVKTFNTKKYEREACVGRFPAQLEVISASHDPDKDVRLETEVIDAGGVVTAVSQAVSVAIA